MPYVEMDMPDEYLTPDETPETPEIPEAEKPGEAAHAADASGDEGMGGGGEPRKTPRKRKPSKKPAKKTAKADGPAEGELTFDPGIITEIAIREAHQIDGIVQLTGSFMDDWVLRRGKGVHVAEVADNGEESYSLDLKISVEYGVDCVKLAKDVRERISKAIKTMTGKTTRQIDVRVTGIGQRAADAHDEPQDDAPVEEGTGIDF